MIFEKASVNDIDELTHLRIAYLEEDDGMMSQETLSSVKDNLPEYFMRHLNRDVTAYVARSDQEIAACAILLVVEKPMSPAFLTGKTGTVLNVYTRPEYRRRGYAKALMRMLLDDAVRKCLDVVELKATEDGYSLYKSLGFCDSDKYHPMKWNNKNN